MRAGPPPDIGQSGYAVSRPHCAAIISRGLVVTTCGVCCKKSYAKDLRVTTLADKIAPYAAQFQRDGFVMVPDLLRAEELERYGAAVDEAVARRKRFDNRTLGEKTSYEQSFIQCINLWEDSPSVRPLTFHPIVCETAARLVGVERLRLWHDQALYKEAGGRLTDPHQDQPYWPMVETDTITALVPFDRSSHMTSCLGYVPGSHTVGLRALLNIFKPADAPQILHIPEIKD